MIETTIYFLHRAMILNSAGQMCQKISKRNKSGPNIDDKKRKARLVTMAIKPAKCGTSENTVNSKTKRKLVNMPSSFLM